MAFAVRAADRRRPAVEVDVREEQALAVEGDVVGDADVADEAAGAGDADRLLHRLLGADALEGGVDADAPGQLLDGGDAVGAALGDDVGRPVFAGELLARGVAAAASWR